MSLGINKLSVKNIRTLPKPVTYGIRFFFRCLSATFRISIIDTHEMSQEKNIGAKIYVTWHNRILFLPLFAPLYFQNKIAILVSLSRDGGYIASLLEAFGFNVIRGSSSRGGTRALKKMVDYLQEGNSIFLIPDGPRGPLYTVHPGVVWLGSTANTPIVPVALNTKRHWQLKGWDKMQIPLPFTPGNIIIGEPIVFPEKVSKKTMATYQDIVRENLMSITKWD